MCKTKEQHTASFELQKDIYKHQCHYNYSNSKLDFGTEEVFA